MSASHLELAIPREILYREDGKVAISANTGAMSVTPAFIKIYEDEARADLIILDESSKAARLAQPFSTSHPQSFDRCTATAIWRSLSLPNAPWCTLTTCASCDENAHQHERAR